MSDSQSGVTEIQLYSIIDATEDLDWSLMDVLIELEIYIMDLDKPENRNGLRFLERNLSLRNSVLLLSWMHQWRKFQEDVVLRTSFLRMERS